MYVLKLEQFEGPLDALLALIEKQKLDITRLSLARIAEEYLALLKDGQYGSLDQMADFLSVASRLLFLKSKSLLPFLVFEPEEEEMVEDLEWRLKEYKRYRDAAVHIHSLWQSENRSFSREIIEMKPQTSTPQNLSLIHIQQSFQNVLEAIQIPEILEEETIETIITIEEKMIAFQTLLAERIEASFAETVSVAEDRMEVIVSFLALLELVKQKIIHADQEDLFVEIRLRRRV